MSSQVNKYIQIYLYLIDYKFEDFVSGLKKILFTENYTGIIM